MVNSLYLLTYPAREQNDEKRAVRAAAGGGRRPITGYQLRSALHSLTMKFLQQLEELIVDFSRLEHHQRPSSGERRQDPRPTAVLPRFRGDRR
jgi:hypothetical protein